MSFIIGVDIGGSHISSAAIEKESNRLVSGTYFKGSVNNKGTKTHILKSWSDIINQSLSTVENEKVEGIGIAMPGPFQYKTGIAMFERNDKYEALYGACVKTELKKFLLRDDLIIRFLNDASSFGIGGTLINNKIEPKNIVAITLGTGFGAAFLRDKIPVTDEKNVPENGCLWDKKFRSGIADDYFSTRWFIKKYHDYTGENIHGVKEIVQLENKLSQKIFTEFADNLSTFLYPYLHSFNADLLIIGGSIAKAERYFLDQIITHWKTKGLSIPVFVLRNTEESSILGASFLFNDGFWKEVKDHLPEL